MIEIIILFFLCKGLGDIAVTKGESPVKWKIFGILAWIAGELMGVMLVLSYFGKDLILFIVFGWGIGYVSFLLVKKSLLEKPDL